MSAPEDLKRKQPLVIGTHSGTFHCDEALALFMLKRLEEFQSAEIIRTRDTAKLAECDVVVDVGGEYDFSKLRFDHHQRGFEETFDEKHSIKLSSAGLIYKHYGKRVVAKELGLPLEDPKTETLYQKIYDSFIEALDGNDNGVPQYPSDVEAAYTDHTHLPSRVSRLNPWWNQIDIDVDARFAKAMELAGADFLDRIHFLGKAWLPARDIVLRALESRNQVDPSGRILRLESPCPWKEHLFDLEEDLGIPEDARPLYAIFPDDRAGQWRIQGVPLQVDSFELRKALPEPWRGYRDEELSEKSGVPGGVFVHHSGFIGGNATESGALDMAKKAVSF
ncbi:GAMM1 protein [Piptocephalis cylindrospora]|uniref:GAMM1 protein n=1 Tax=Piptocephalis cylindrospora TaxID=1907219 RepID=A0A4P9Y666_9FUNG|nr:GAMM1 protein [Piptocephalis cylindrospora]|eukprot:RKP14517.1 GAMM1 protein [Piptocephalis cylindrospora]